MSQHYDSEVKAVCEALEQAHAWARSVFTHWRSPAARTAAHRIEAFFDTEAERYQRMLRRYGDED